MLIAVPVDPMPPVEPKKDPLQDLVPAKTPKAIIDKLAAAADKALKSSGITAKFAKDDARAGGGTPEQFTTFIRKEQATWKRIIEKTGLKIE